MHHNSITLTSALLALVALLCTPGLANAKQLLWGDTHLHTSYSFDAFLNNNLTADPDTAYRFAKGEPVIHPYNRARVQLGQPLDFLVVSDHAEFIGGIRHVYRNGLDLEDAGFIAQIVGWYRLRELREAIDNREGAPLFRSLLPASSKDPREVAATFGQAQAQQLPVSPETIRNAWHEIVDVADAHYEPGKFTSLIGWEWSSIPGGANLHRIVVTDADAQTAKTFQPFSSLESPYPDDLWAWLEKTSEETSASFIAIPHNSNISKGWMFPRETLRGGPVDAAYAINRMRWEPVVEATQIKGDSETHPLLSPNDEFADFEEYSFYIEQQPGQYQAQAGDYVRSALKTGLELGAETGVNPYQFGLIGSTDAHTGLSTAEEDNFWGKMATDSTPETKINTLITGGSRGWTMSASGMAAVWAEENTREAIVAAMRRREVYATTGPRLRVRFFGGWEYESADLEAEDLGGIGYAKGVPMGGELTAASEASAPSFMVVALKEPGGANLDRIQIVKGWLDADGNAEERVYDVVWSGDRLPGADGRLPAVGNTVDLRTARYANDIGAVELAAVWRDPDFDPGESAFYYARVLQIPTPRHALYDALALGMDKPTVGPAVIQERAYTSPIWYAP
ncbi:MAG: DUF3604 domain-containing protein [Pseudomonadales bacterium]|nr:DUF3604 domain-containing protein [Pseudomonadales bacterium]NIX09927.1 DUF3604 domain-containing protein [Pseudomonadales bacterium]